MRNIKFRGRDITNNEFVYGYLIKKRNHALCEYMIQEENGLCSDIITESIGQFTGEVDENGIEIYEGDYISINSNTPPYEVAYIDACFCLGLYMDMFEEYKFFAWGSLRRAKEKGIKLTIV